MYPYKSGFNAATQKKKVYSELIISMNEITESSIGIYYSFYFKLPANKVLKQNRYFFDLWLLSWHESFKIK